MQGIFEVVQETEEFLGIFGWRKITERHAKINVAVLVLITPGIRAKKIEPSNVVATANRPNLFLYFLQIHEGKLVGSTILGKQ